MMVHLPLFWIRQRFKETISRIFYKRNLEIEKQQILNMDFAYKCKLQLYRLQLLKYILCIVLQYID